MSKNNNPQIKTKNKSDNNHCRNDAVSPATSQVVSTTISPTGKWITDKAWICGVVGALAVVFCAVWFNSTKALEKGVFIAGCQITSTRLDSLLVALFLCAGVMLAVEVVRLWLWDRQNFFCIDPDIEEEKYFVFLLKAVGNYLLYLCLLGLAIVFYRSAIAYGFQQNQAYYQSWFRLLEIVWNAYLWAGLPYVILTRAIKHSPIADRRDMTTLLLKILLRIGSRFFGVRSARTEFDEMDKKNARALLVKLFFAPLMTVFFTEQFSLFVGNIGYVFRYIPELIANSTYTHSRFNADFFNVSISFIFSIDVALAWCGYVVSSRWVDNQTASAEPTILGWLVCVSCYPPFQQFLSLYYAPPGEREVLQFTNQGLITFFTCLMLLSYLVYMSATLWFGVRFSNLTNRGIIRKGPYALIRHPAYAAKNFAWWCVMFPAIIYNAQHTGLFVAVFQMAGLIFMTWFYYLRAITEERHLSLDSAYLDYCKQVKYRFIPGIL